MRNRLVNSLPTLEKPMTPTHSPKTTITYSEATIKRAERALSCSPFQLDLFKTMASQSVPLPNIAGKSGIAQQYTLKPLSENQVERYLMWLITVGILRREVDGQGITDSFRLTPLGRRLIAQWDTTMGQIPTPRWWERLLNSLQRWLQFLG